MLFFQSFEKKTSYYLIFCPFCSTENILRNFVLFCFIGGIKHFAKNYISWNKQLISYKNGIRFAPISKKILTV
jgi:hypothetical protein